MLPTTLLPRQLGYKLFNNDLTTFDVTKFPTTSGTKGVFSLDSKDVIEYGIVFNILEI